MSSRNHRPSVRGGDRRLVDRVDDPGRRASALLAEGRVEQALAVIRQAMADSPPGASLLNLAAICLVRLGDPVQAESCWQQALVREPLDANLHYNLGNLLGERQQLASAEAAYRRAIHLRPDHVGAGYHLGLLLIAQHRYQEAEEVCRRLLQCQPELAMVWNQLGILLAGQERFAESQAAYRQALSLQPDCVPALGNLALLLAQGAQFAAALACFQQVSPHHPDRAAIGIRLADTLAGQRQFAASEGVFRQLLQDHPDHAEACNRLGILLAGQGHLAAALAAYREAVRRQPDHVSAHNNLGILLTGQHRYQEAETAFREALRLHPDHAEACNNLGNLLKELRREDEAESLYRRAIALRPDYIEAHTNLGTLLTAQRRYEEAEAAYQRALACNPADFDARYHLGILLQEGNRLDEAESAYREVSRLQPDHAHALTMARYCARRQCRWQSVAADDRAVQAMLARQLPLQPFTLLSLADEDGQVQKQVAARAVIQQVGSILSRPPLVDPRHHPRRERLRIGYLSADFHDHATTRLVAGVLEAQDRKRFALHGYAYGPDFADAGRRRIVDACEGFHLLGALSDEEGARQISGDEIDILVDLKGHTRHFRPGITAWRPAPILVNWLGFPGTLGHPRLADYLIGDPVVTPPSMAENYSETLALMPHSYQPNDRLRPVADPPTRREAGLPDAGVVLGCFNQSYKLGPESFGVWCRVLEAVPDSGLWLLSAGPVAEANLRREAGQRGLDPDRLRFAPKRPLAEHLGRLALMDLALDTFPVTSHTTGSDALWCGVPLITRIGETLVSRVAASLLSAVGLPELVTSDWEEYVELAVALARHPERLQAVRARLLANRLTHPLFDVRRFTRHLEQLYERMWQDHGDGKRAMIMLADSGEGGR